MEKRNEQEQLRKLLTEKGIEHEAYTSESGVEQVRFRVGTTKWSVICGWYSYGGREGLLEAWDMVRSHQPEGWLTAEEVLEKVLTESRGLTDEKKSRGAAAGGADRA